MSTEVDHANTLINYIGEHWPLLMVILTTASGGMMWIKRKVINDVYATKEEMRDCRASLNKEIKGLSKQMSENHDEIKDLIIDTLKDKRD